MCGSTKVQGNWETCNQVLIQGDVKSLNKSGFTVTTIGVATDRREFENTLEVVCPGKKAFEIGDKIKFAAQLTQVEENGEKRTKLATKPDQVIKKSKDDGYVNLARLLGPVNRYRYLGPTADGKQGIGTTLIQIGANMFRAVVFNTLAIVMDRDGKRGAVVDFEGRIQHSREFVNRRTGKLDTMLELAVDDQRSKILVKSTDHDPYAEFQAELNGTQGELAAEGEIPF